MRTWRLISAIFRRHGLVLGLILALAAGVRLLHLAADPPQATAGDAQEYHVIAQTWLTTGRYIGPPQGFPDIPRLARRTPLYPGLLALAYGTGKGQPLADIWLLIGLAQIAFDLITCWIIYLIGKQIANHRVGLAAALIFALYPPAIFATSWIMTETLTALWLALTTLFLVRGFIVGRLSSFLLSGFFLGLATLTHPSASLLPLVLIVAMPALYRGRLRQLLLSWSALVLMFGVTLSPWLIRNWLVFQRPAPLSTLGGLNFWSGNYLPFKGKVRPASYHIMRYDVLKNQEVGELEADRKLWQEGRKNIGRYLRESPGRYLQMLGDKFSCFWGSAADQSLKHFPFTTAHLHSALLLLALVGFLISPFRWRQQAGLVAMVAAINLCFVATHCEETRHNLPIMPEVIVLATVGLFFLLGGLGDHSEDRG